jgi:hypothetical protein
MLLYIIIFFYINNFILYLYHCYAWENYLLEMKYLLQIYIGSSYVIDMLSFSLITEETTFLVIEELSL